MKNFKRIFTLITLLAVAITASAAVYSASVKKTTPTPKPKTTKVVKKVTATPKPKITTKPIAKATATPKEKTFNAADLAKFNGKNGNPAYVAVNGVVYDVTNEPQWRGGKHKGYPAGLDLSDAIAAAPHGLSILDRVPVVGKYVK